MTSTPYETLSAACAKIRSRDNRRAVDLIIVEAYDNANYTVYVEKAASEDRWAEIFAGSIGSLLANGEYNANVVKFFAARGISY
jgi:hypothetical protein